MQDLVAAHQFSSNHRAEVISSEKCGCFYCTETFVPSAIHEWIDWPIDTPGGQENAAGQTALCPKCGIDSVIGSASGYPISIEFLEQMRKHWFS